jgi:hypothetical protein
MDIQASSSENLFEGLPRIIGLPGCLPARPEYRRTPLAEVCVAEELPPYLLLGSLDRRSFRATDDDWSARWIGRVPDTYVEARYERATRRLELEQVWRGIEGGTSYTTSDDFGQAIQMLYLPFPETWDRAMGPRLEGTYGLKYVAAGKDQCGFTGIPDGGFKTLCVPVPVARLTDLHECFARLSCDPELPVPMGGRLELRVSAVNHVTGRGPAWTENPEWLFAESFETNGLLPLERPRLDIANNRTSAWTVRRLVYLALVQVPFAGVEFVVERLAARGLIRRRTDAADPGPGIEFDAFVGPSAIDLQSRSVAWMDEQRACRVFYLLNSDEELSKGGVERMAIAEAQTDEEARELIRQAVLVSVRQRNRLASLMGCEECVS